MLSIPSDSVSPEQHLSFALDSLTKAYIGLEEEEEEEKEEEEEEEEINKLRE